VCNAKTTSDPKIFQKKVGRKLPLVFVDSRAPPEEALVSSAGQSLDTLQLTYYERAKAHLDAVEAQLAATTSWNFYRASTISFLHSSIQDFTGTTNLT
jgi:hypothetical protein